MLPDPERAPTGAELVERYVAPLAALEELAPRIRTGVEVIGVTREGMDRTRTARRSATPFAVRIRTAGGGIEDVPARAVIDASGTYRSPNSLSSMSSTTTSPRTCSHSKGARPTDILRNKWAR